MRKNDSLSKLADRKANYSKFVQDRMEQAQVNEEERVERALWNTEESKVNFLQRLELQNKETNMDHKAKFDAVAEKKEEVKLR